MTRWSSVMDGGRLVRRLKGLPDRLAAIASERLYASRWTSPTATIPSSVSLEGIEGFLRDVGITSGSTLFVHASWKHLDSGKFSPIQLIKHLLNPVGLNGTLAMPAFPPYQMQKNGALFDVRKTPTGAGLLADIFRRYPGVVRSINLNHSVCAIGPNAAFLTKDHQHSETSWDKFSPYFRLRELDDAWIVGLGVGHRLKVATALHCVDSALWKENQYFAKLFSEEICYTYKDAVGHAGSHCYKRRIGQIYTPKLARYFPPEELREDTIEGLDVYAINARLLIDKAIELGREGKTMYIWPVPMPWHFW